MITIQKSSHFFYLVVAAVLMLIVVSGFAGYQVAQKGQNSPFQVSGQPQEMAVAPVEIVMAPTATPTALPKKTVIIKNPEASLDGVKMTPQELRQYDSSELKFGTNAVAIIGPEVTLGQNNKFLLENERIVEILESSNEQKRCGTHFFPYISGSSSETCMKGYIVIVNDWLRYEIRLRDWSPSDAVLVQVELNLSEEGIIGTRFVFLGGGVGSFPGDISVLIGGKPVGFSYVPRTVR